MTNSLRVNAALTNNPSEKNYDETVIVNDSLVVTISYGFNQEARYGRFVMLQVDVYNKGETFEGAVTGVLVNENQDNIAYSKEGQFISGVKSEFNLLLPMNRSSQDMVFSIQDEKNNTIVEELIPLNVMNLGDYCYVGILSEMSTQLTYFEYFGNKVVNLDKTNLSSDYLAYDMLDVIVVDQFELDSLEPTQLEALLEWTRCGGALVLGIDEDYMQNVELLEQYRVIQLAQDINYEASEGNIHMVNLLEESEFTKQLTKIKNYEATRSQILKEIEDSKIFGTFGKSDIYIGTSMLGGLTINDLAETRVNKSLSLFSVENSKASIYKNHNYLYEAVNYGEGVVQLFHFGLSNSNMTEENLSLYGSAGGELLNTFFSSIVMTVLEQRSANSVLRNATEVYADAKDYRITNISSNPEIDQVPQVAGYLVVFVIYLLVIGPILFFVLWKLKKQMRVWIYVPLLTLLFLFIMYGMGSSTRIKESYAGYMDIEYYDTSMKQIEGKTFASIVLTNKSANTIKLETADSLVADEFEYPTYYSKLYQVTESAQKFYDYCKASTKITFEEDGIELQFYNRPAFSGELFEASYHKPFEEFIDGKVVIGENSISGEISNQSNSDLKQALLWVNGYYVDLGTVKAGSTVEIPSDKGVYSSHIETLMYSENKVSKARGFMPNQSYSAQQSREVNALSYIYSHYLRDTQSAYLIAFTDKVSSASPITQIAQKKASYGVSAVVAKVNLKTQDSLTTMVTNLDMYLDAQNEYAWDQEIRYAYMNTIEFEYNIPKKERLLSLFLSDMFNDFSDQMIYDSLLCSRIYLYNYEVEKYDLVFDLESEYGSRSIDYEELKPYLSKDNELKVKYENRSTTQDMVAVPIISCYKEAVDATN
jgi:hypothetical protein